MKKTLILISGVILFNTLFFTLCTSRPPIEIKIDNPTDSTIILKIDDKPLSIQSHTLRAFEVKPGIRKFEYNSIVKFQDIDYQDKYLINPTKSKYYFDKIWYYTEQWNDNIKNSNKIDTTTIEGYKVKSPVEITNDFIIIGKWSFWPYEYIPNSIEEKQEKYSLGIAASSKIKVYSENEYLRTIEMNFGAAIIKAEKLGMPKETIKILLEINDEQFEKAKNMLLGKK